MDLLSVHSRGQHALRTHGVSCFLVFVLLRGIHHLFFIGEKLENLNLHVFAWRIQIQVSRLVVNIEPVTHIHT